jgi:hypothetical protein
VRRDRANGCLFRSPAEAPAQEFKQTEESPATEKSPYHGIQTKGIYSRIRFLLIEFPIMDGGRAGWLPFPIESCFGGGDEAKEIQFTVPLIACITITHIYRFLWRLLVYLF